MESLSITNITLDIKFQDRQKVYCLKPSGEYKIINNEKRIYVVKSAKEGLLYNHDEVKFDPYSGECFYKGLVCSDAWQWQNCILVPVLNRDKVVLA